MTNDVKVFLAVIVGTLLLIFGMAFLLGKGNKEAVLGVPNDVLVRADSWGIGSPSATISVVEFSDFECPACKLAEPEVQRVVEKYRKDIRFYYRHFPLAQHTQAIDAATAAEAAGKQGVDKFWAMHAKLFANQPEFWREKLIGYAKDLGLDVDKFTADLDAQEIRQRVLNDQADGNRARVNSTPTFFVNGTKIGGYSRLDAEISYRLK